MMPLVALPLLFTLLLAVIAVGVTASLLRRAELDWPLKYALLLSVAVTTFAVVLTAHTYTNAVWNSARAVIPVSLVRGVPPYFPPGEGPLWASIYPPLAYVLYAPIAFAQTPANVIRLGQIMGFLFIWVPFVLLLIRASQPFASRDPGVIAATVFGLSFATTTLGLSNATFIVHVDPPAIGLALAACIPLLGVASPSRRALALSAALAAASVFCKQTMLPVALAIPLYLALATTPRHALTFLGVFLATATALLAACLLAFSPSGMLNNILVVPASHPWRDDHPHPLLYASQRYLLEVGLFPLFAAAIVGIDWRNLRPLPRLRRLAARPAFLLFFVGIALLPGSIAAFAKAGGFVNNFATSAYFFLAVFSLWPLSIGDVPNRLSRLLYALLLIVICIRPVNRLVEISNLPPRPNIHDAAYTALLDNPDRIYFPWLPLSHYLANRTLTHQSFGIQDRENARQGVSDAWLRQYIPPHTEVIAFDTPPSPAQDRAFSRLAPEFPLPVTIPSLPGWPSFAKLPPTPPPTPLPP